MGLSPAYLSALRNISATMQRTGRRRKSPSSSPQILREREAVKKPKKQTNLDGIVIKEKRPADFTQDRILEAVAKFIACDDQVSRIFIAQRCF